MILINRNSQQRVFLYERTLSHSHVPKRFSLGHFMYLFLFLFVHLSVSFIKYDLTDRKTYIVFFLDINLNYWHLSNSSSAHYMFQVASCHFPVRSFVKSY